MMQYCAEEPLKNTETTGQGITKKCRLSWLTNSALVHEPEAGIFKQSMGARNQVGIGLSYRPARLHRLAEFIPWNRFLGSINV
jgi:hypothetical protein